MNEQPTYPSITDTSLVPFRAIEVQLKTTPDLLERSDCPYPPHIRTFLKRLVQEGPSAPPPTGPMSEDDLEAEIASLYRELQTASAGLTGIDPKDKATFLKTNSDLLTKLVALKERMLNVRMMGQFQRAVVELLEGVLTPAQRSEFVEKLGKYVDLQG